MFPSATVQMYIPSELFQLPIIHQAGAFPAH